MSVFTSLIIILLAMVIQAFLQLTPGVFSIFYHHALGKTSAKKADDQSLSFILGVEIFTAIAFLATYIVITFFVSESDFMSTTFLWIMSGFFLAEAIFIYFCYFRKSPLLPFPSKKQKSTQKFKKSQSSTALFLPRHFAKNLALHAENVKSRSDTVTLGLVTAALDLIFTLPLYIVCSIAILNLTGSNGAPFIITYIVVATIPLFTIRTFFRTGRSLAKIQRFRAEKKPVFRLLLSLSYIALSIIIFITGAPK